MKDVALEKDDSIAQIKEEMKSAKVHLHMRFQAQSAHMTNNHQNLTRKHSECVEENKGRFGQMEEMILHLNQQVSVLIAESNDLKRLFKKGIDLANNVKRMVALTAASEEVEKILWRKEEEKELWSFFFRGLSGDKWARLGVNDAKARELLGAGAYEFNELIHNTPPQDVVESIVCIPPGLERTVWEEFFFLAFKRKILEVYLFSEETLYAEE